MVTTVTPYSDTRNRAYPGEGYDGVVRVSVGAYYGSGALLYDGRAVLTAAHLFSHGSTKVSVQFETSQGTQTLDSSRTEVLSNYDPINGNNDLALVWLPAAAPAAADRYTLYRGGDEVGQVFTFAGYGTPGTGVLGADGHYSGAPMRLKASNQFDIDAAALKNLLGPVMAWTPSVNTQLMADFDNGIRAQDALGRLANIDNMGSGPSEGLIAPGDSGGPSFLKGQVAGVASYTASLSQGGVHPDIDGTANSSFGEIASWQRVGYFQQWIDQSLRSQYPNAPTKPAEVQKFVAEGNSGTSLSYFLLQFTGVRSDPNQLLSVDYATRDGTAKAGQDYLAASGKLVLYSDEDQAVIPVEIVGNTTPEPDKTFYLDVFNPVGGHFGDGVVKLTAIRTIINDDGGIWA